MDREREREGERGRESLEGRNSAVNRERNPAAEKEETLRAAGRELGSRLPGERGAAAAALLVLAHARTHPSYFTGASPTWLADQGERLFGLIDRPLTGFHVETRVEKFPGGGPRTILETVGPDQPFIVDSLLELVRVRGRRLLEAIHPIVSVARGPDGRVKELGPPRKDAELVSLVRLEIEDTLPEKERLSLEGEARAVLGEAQVVVRDFEPMMERLRALEASLEARGRGLPAGPERDAVLESREFLAWLRRSNFVFLAYRAVRKAPGASGEVEPVPGSGLGLLREGAAPGAAGPSPEIDAPRPRTGDSPLVLVHKTSRESRVLRRARMDCIHVQEIDGGSPAGAEHRFLGLFTARAYNDLPSDIPLLRQKLDVILQRANVVPGSHDHKEIFSIFTSIPKAELFVTETEKIAEMIFGIMSASRRREVRVSFRPDFLERGVSVMVLLPRERFSPEARVAIQEYLAGEFHGTLIDYRLALSEEPMARLHFYFAAPPGKLAEPPLDGLEKRISEMTRTWADRLLEALEREDGKAGTGLAERYARAFPPAYFTQKSPDTAVADIHHIEKVLSGKVPVEAALAHGKGSTGKKVSILKIFRPDEPFALSALMPILTNLDLTVLDEQTFRIIPVTGEPPRGRSREDRATREVFLHSFRVLTSAGELLPPGQAGRNIEDTILGAMAREVEDDALNALVTRAALDAREVDVLRAYDSYLHQLGGPWTRRTTYAALRENPSVAAALVRFFQARFDPRPAAAARAQAEARALESLHEELAKVSGIHEDQVLRAFENLISASVRTSWYLPAPHGRPRDAVSIKIRCAAVARMPDPRPLFEIFVHGIGVEGVHLRSGKVARGGIRWSSRIDDYRMEILGLMKAQRTKNAVIVPVGAKGGFIVKGGAGKAEEILRPYQIFIGALLDVTDNVVEGKVVHPKGVVIHDEPDPYLVVAADRGTAGFSDVANEIATSRSFWLGDAFASGGSRGYNHKAEGITARGAWECVRRHFREMGRDPDRETFTVAGMGDMSGDVFGNGLIYSRNMRLLAAFNHIHVFIDPNPDPVASFEERSRLFKLPGSAWTDYDPSRISAGGGVHRRDAKSIRLSPEARRALGIDAETLNGEELVAAVLRMPVDLLWNGGIGTYVKARTETHQDVGDPVNNAVRVDGADLRARIVAEGGNLGFTQLGRIEYARAGGRINTDFIDNSAGVDLSDHEVNLKILLGSALARKLIEEKERDEILVSVKEEVCKQVLRDNYLQSLAISLDERSAPGLIEEHRFLIEELESAGLLDREVEDIPTTEQLTRLRDSKIGLTRPTLAVLLAYAKIDAYLRLLGTSLPESPDLDGFLVDYFPDKVAGKFSEEIHRHALRREIAATTAVNAAINHMGITFLHRLSRRSGAELDAVLRAYLIAGDLSGAASFFAAADALYASGPGDLPALHGVMARFRAAVEATTLEVLERRLLGKPASEIAAAYAKKVEDGLEQLGPPDARPATPSDLPGADLAELEAAASRAERVSRILDIVGLAERAKVDFAPAHAAWEKANELLQIGRIETEASRIARSTAEDIQTVDSLVEEARSRRAAVASSLLAMDAKPKKKAALLDLPAVKKERARVVRLLEMARTRQPLTPAGLFVIVEALGRIVREVSPRASRG